MYVRNILFQQSEASADHPMLVLDKQGRTANIIPTGPLPILSGRQPLVFWRGGENVSADILKIDASFVSLLKWLGEIIPTCASQVWSREDGYAVYKIREIAFGGGSKLSAEDGFAVYD